MSNLEALILGFIQGLTEFLPVSSSGHLTIFKNFFGVDGENLSFEIVVHAATVLSTIFVFRREIWNLLLGFFNLKMNPQKEYVFKILVSLIPIMIVGFFFKDYVESIFGSGLLIVGIMLIITAALLSISEYITKKQISSNSEANKPITYKDAFIIGIAQAFAVLPGLSRSGSTISTGLMLGIKRSEIAQFSFLMVLIPVLGEAFLSIVGGDLSGEASGIEALPLIIGFISAFISGVLACRLMINLVKRLKLWAFAIYCFIIGAGCLIYSIIN
jgi:Uncharacterized bacitracin resistance protein